MSRSPWASPGLVNAAMLIMAAATFHQHGLTNVGTIEEAYQTLTPLLGGGGELGLRHLAAGLGPVVLVGRHDGRARSSCRASCTGTIPVWIRRLVTMVPR